MRSVSSLKVSEPRIKKIEVRCFKRAAPSEQGHEILRTPPYHPELQPIETCWAVVKNQIARKSKFTMAHLLEQLDDAFDSVTEETCSGLIKKVREVEDKYWREDAQLDRWQ